MPYEVAVKVNFGGVTAEAVGVRGGWGGLPKGPGDKKHSGVPGSNISYKETAPFYTK